MLDRGLVFGNQDGLSRFDEDTAISLNSPTPRWWSGECMIWVHAGGNWAQFVWNDRSNTRRES